MFIVKLIDGTELIIPDSQHITFKGMDLIGDETVHWNEPLQRNFAYLADSLTYKADSSDLTETNKSVALKADKEYVILELSKKSDSTHNHDDVYAKLSHSHTWEDINQKPSSYPPSAHTHLEADLTIDKSWNAIQSKPNTRDGFGITDVFTKSETTQAITSQINLLGNGFAGVISAIQTEMANDDSAASALLTNVNTIVSSIGNIDNLSL